MEAQRARDGIEVPGLSRAAWAAVRAVEQAGEAAERGARSRADKDPVWRRLTVRLSPEVAQAWTHEVAGRPKVAAELEAVVEVTGQRFGAGPMRELARKAQAAQEAGQRDGISALVDLGRVLEASQGGRLAQEAQERARERQRQGLNPRQAPRPRA